MAAACLPCCAVDRNETTFVPDKVRMMKDDQVLADSSPAIVPVEMKMSMKVAPVIEEAPTAPATIPAEPADYAGAWMESSGGVYMVTDVSIIWSGNSASEITFIEGTMQLKGGEMVATLDETKTVLTWNDGDVWKKTSSPTDFVGAWEDANTGSVYSITETTLKWSSTVSSNIVINGGSLECDGATATMDETKTKLTWDDGDVWSRTQDPTEYCGGWEDSGKAVYVISGTTLKWSSTSSSKIRYSGGQLQLEDSAMTASLDASKNTLTWSDGDVWTRTVDPSDFEGAWQNKEGDVNIVESDTVRWSNSTSSKISYTGGIVELSGSTATLDETKTKLIFNDGDEWNRPGLDGYWKKDGFEGAWQIGGATLTTLMTTGQKWTNTLTISGKGSVDVTVNNVTVSGTLDKAAMWLTWSDGDSWKRAHVYETPFK